MNKALYSFIGFLIFIFLAIGQLIIFALLFSYTLIHKTSILLFLLVVSAVTTILFSYFAFKIIEIEKPNIEDKIIELEKIIIQDKDWKKYSKEKKLLEKIIELKEAL